MGWVVGLLSLFHERRKWWDSPYINHFLQPDTIIPGIGSQSFNRYSYVLNNPINASDPTGHKCVGEPGECLNAKGKPINGSQGTGWQNGGSLSFSARPNRPDYVNPTTEKSTWLYSAYTKMWEDKTGWWWEKYGSGGFTIWEFMAAMWGYEQQGYPNTGKYAAALGNHAPGWCDYMGCDPSSAEGSLQFLGAYNQVSVARAKKLYFNPQLEVVDIFGRPKSYWPGDSMRIVEAIQQDYFSGNPDELYDLGNVSMRDKIFRKMAMLGMIDTVWGLPGQDSMIMLTYCQWQMMNYALITDGAKSINLRTYRNFCGG